MNKQRRMLATRLSRIIIILAIPIFVVALGVFYDHTRALIREEAAERSRAVLHTTVRRVENYVTTIETAARSNVWMIEEEFNPDSIAMISRRIVMLNPSVISCSVSVEPDMFPDYGRYFSVFTANEGDTILTMLEEDFDYFNHQWYRMPMQTGHSCWVNPFSDFNQGTINHNDAVGSFCIPLRPGDGSHVSGVVSVDFSFKKLKETILDTERPYPSSYYIMLGPIGGFLVHPDPNLLYKQTIFSSTDSVQHPDIIALGRAMTSRQRGTMHVKFGDKMCHVCYEPIAETGWSLALVSPEDEVLSDYRHLGRILAVVIIIGLVIIAWLTRRVVRKNMEPLNELLEATKRMAGGNFETILPLSNHKDVVGQLQNAFREMQMAIISYTRKNKETSKEIQKQNEELQQSMKLVEEASRRKKTFIQNVFRQITTPLNIIEGLSAVMINSLSSNTVAMPQPDEVANITNTMRYNALQLYRIMNMLYDSSDTGMSDTDRYKREDKVGCNAVVRETFELIKGLYPKAEYELITEVPDTLTVQTNHLYLTRNLLELLHNSVKYSDGKHIKLIVTQTDSAVQFTVQDVGPGIPAESRELLFQPFAKVEDLSEGLGLGLPLVKAHVDGLHCRLILDESYHEGCRFTIEVPKDIPS